VQAPRFAASLARLFAALPMAALAGGVHHIDRLEVGAQRSEETGILDAASQGTVTREQLENRPLLRPGELLETVPGLIVTQHSGSGKANQYFLRGFNLDHGTDFRTTVLGMPVNLPTHGHGQGYTDMNFLIPELVSSIQYKKGTYYAEEGDFSAAGAAHVDLLRRLDAPLVDLTLGEDRYRRVMAAASTRPTAVGGTWLGAVEALQEDGPWDLPQDLRKLNALVRWSEAAADGISVAAMAYRNRWDSTDQVPRRAIESGQIGRFGYIDPTLGGETHRYSLSAEWTGRAEESTTRARAHAIDYGLNLFSNFTYFLDDPVDGDQFEQADRRKVFGASVEHVRLGRIGATATEHAFGLEARHDRIDTVGLYHTVARTRIGTTREDEVRQTSLSAWYRNTTQWTPWLRSIAGARVDDYRFDVSSSLAENSGEASDRIANPKLTLVAGPFSGTEFFLNLGGGFHSNDARGSTIRVDPSTGEPVERVDPLVRARGGEVGMHAHLSPAWETSVALWRLELDSELLFVGDAGTTEASRPSRRTGIEWANYWRPMTGLVADVDLAWSRARFTDGDPAGDRIPGAIERTASAGVSYDTGPWSAGLRVRYFGARPLVEDDSARSASSTLVNLKAGYRFSRAVKASVEILNLFDRETSDIDYYYESRLAGEPGPVADIHTHPAEPRTIRATLTVRF
jgi:outer membrane receptor protein involved in Fe transport